MKKIILLLLLIPVLFAQAQVTVTAPTANLCIGAGYINLGTITIYETHDTDLANTGGSTVQLILTRPSANLHFNPGALIVAKTTSSAGTFNGSLAGVATDSTIIISYKLASTAGNTGGFTINGIQVKATGPASGNLLRIASDSGNAVIYGDQVANTQNHATFHTSLSPKSPSVPAPAAACPPNTVTITPNSVTNTQFNFYSTSTGGTALSGPGNNYSGISSTQTIYVEADSNNCLSLTRTSVNAMINVTPRPPAGLSSTPVCSGTNATVTTTPVTNVTFSFYSNASGGSSVSNSFGSSQTVYVQADSSNGCSSATRTPVSVTVNNLPPAPTFSNTNVTRCGNGTFSLPVTNDATGNVYNIWSASSGGSVITGGNNLSSPIITPIQNVGGPYNYYISTTNNGCTSSSRTQITLTVNAGPTTSLNGLNSKYCRYDTPDTLFSFPTNGSYASLAGLTDLGGGKALFNPLAANKGTTLTINYSAISTGCTTTVSKNTIVYDTSAVVFTSPIGNTININSTATLQATPVGGTFAGPGVSGNTFYPQVAQGIGPGPYTILYNVTDVNGCGSKGSDVLSVVSGNVVNLSQSYCQNTVTVPIRITGIDTNFVSGSYEFLSITGPGISGIAGDPDSYVLNTSNVNSSYLNTSQNVTVTTRRFLGNTRCVYITGCSSCTNVPLPYTGYEYYTYSFFGFNYCFLNYVSYPQWDVNTTTQPITIYAQPVPPSIVNAKDSFCLNSVIPNNNFSAVGSSINWYNSSNLSGTPVNGNNPSTSNLTPYTTNTYGIKSMWVTQTINGCASNAAISSIYIINSVLPPTGIASVYNYCQNDLINPLSANGISLKWYDHNNNYLAQGATYTPPTTIVNTSIVGNTTINVTQTKFGCESGTASTTIVVNSIPTPPTPIPSPSYCQGQNIDSLKSTSQNNYTVNWYSDSTLNNLLVSRKYSASASQLNINSNTAKTFKVYITDSSQYCRSNAVPVSLTVYGYPTAPALTSTTADTNNYCYNTLLQSIGASPSVTNNSIKWYKNSNKTGLLQTGTSFLPDTGTYHTHVSNTTFYPFYATQTQNGCESPVTPTIIRVFAQTPQPIVPNASVCQGLTAPLIIAKHSTSVPGTYITWYNQPTLSGTPSPGDTLNIDIYKVSTSSVQTNFFYAVQTANNCPGPAAQASLIVNPKPVPPTPVYPPTYCQGQAIANLSATTQNNYTVNWYSDSSLSHLLVSRSSNVSASQLNINGDSVKTLKVYITDSSQYCMSNPVPIPLTVYAYPVAPALTSPTLDTNNYCFNSILQSIGASPSATGNTIKWYSNPNASGLLQTGKNFLPDTSIYHTQVAKTILYHFYATQTVNGCESPVTPTAIRVYAQTPQPVASPLTVCQDLSTPLLIAKRTSSIPGTYITWYNQPTLTGNSFKEDTLNPAQYLISSSTVQTNFFYAVQTANNCPSPALQTILTVYPKPVVSLGGLASQYCIYNPDVILTGSPTDSKGKFKGKGITDHFNGTSTFSPSVAKDSTGKYQIVYTYTNSYGCTDSSTQNFVKVNPRPVLTFSGLDSLYCNYPTGSVTLTPRAISTVDNYSQTNGGFFITGGNGISGNTFYPNFAGVGLKKITYKYTEPNTGCANDTTNPLAFAITRVYPLPKTNLKIVGLCQGDSNQFLDLSTIDQSILQSNINAWNWNFTGGPKSIFTTSSQENPKVSFADFGSYAVDFTATSNKGCHKDTSVSFTVGPYPTPDFTAKNVCFGDLTKMVDNSSILAGNIIRYSWKLDTKQSADTSSLVSPTFTYNASKTYDVSLSITSDKNCTASLTKKVSILPTISSFPYYQNFDTSTGNWAVELDRSTNSDWAWGAANKKYIYPKHKGDQFWVTNLDSSYKLGQNSWVNGPCFNFSTIQRPMIAFLYKNVTVGGNDGAVLQTSIDGDSTWQVVGSLNDGLNWFNTSGILSKPGGQTFNQFGWSGATDSLSGWTVAKRRLDELKGNKSVRMRIAFSSLAQGSSSYSGLDGFAFDSIWVGERSKLILVENFTNDNDPTCAQQDPQLYNYMNSRQLDLVGLEYHTSFPGRDTFNYVNPSQPSARVLYYGIQKVPKVIPNGVLFNWDSLGGNKLIPTTDLLALEVPSFKIALNKTVTNNQVSATVTVTANDTLPSNEYILQMALIERVVTAITGSNGETRFENVLKYFSPSAAGTSYVQSWKPGDQQTYTAQWSPPNVYNSSQLGVVAFVQNNNTREVYQAAYSGPEPAVTALPVTPSLVSGIGWSLYPNPAGELVYVVSNGLLPSDTRLQLVNALGEILTEHTMVAGSQGTTLQVQGLPAGLYLVRISGGNTQPNILRLVVR